MSPEFNGMHHGTQLRDHQVFRGSKLIGTIVPKRNGGFIAKTKNGEVIWNKWSSFVTKSAAWAAIAAHSK